MEYHEVNLECRLDQCFSIIAKISRMDVTVIVNGKNTGSDVGDILVARISLCSSNVFVLSDANFTSEMI